VTFQEAITAVGRKTTGVKRWIADWAKELGGLAHASAQNGAEEAGVPWGYGVADALVFSNVKKALGLTRCKIAYTGAAPIAGSTLDFFGRLGIHVMELYGMSECTGPQTIACPGFFKVGTCGHSLPGCELGILLPPTEEELAADPNAKAKSQPVGQEGEICFRGRHVMLGYMGEDMEAKTAETIDSEGWLHSGDKGKVDGDGLLSITGRYKELLITAGGENIAPVPVEEAIKDALPMVEYVTMVADKRKFCSCIFVLKTKPGVNEKDQPIATEELMPEALAVDPDCKTIADACGEDYNGTAAWQAALTEGVKAYNANPVSQAAKIQAFKICRDGFSFGNGLLTDTMKLKRSKVYTKHSPLIELLYAEADLKMGESAVKKAASEDDKAAAAADLATATKALEEAKAVLAAEYNPEGKAYPTDF